MNPYKGFTIVYFSRVRESYVIRSCSGCYLAKDFVSDYLELQKSHGYVFEYHGFLTEV